MAHSAAVSRKSVQRPPVPRQHVCKHRCDLIDTQGPANCPHRRTITLPLCAPFADNHRPRVSGHTDACTHVGVVGRRYCRRSSTHHRLQALQPESIVGIVFYWKTSLAMKKQPQTAQDPVSSTDAQPPLTPTAVGASLRFYALRWSDSRRSIVDLGTSSWCKVLGVLRGFEASWTTTQTYSGLGRGEDRGGCGCM